jgi:hypothetical protein
MFLKKSSIRIVITSLFFLFLTTNLSGQHSNTMYFLKNVPQSGYLNPARQFRCNFYLGFPGISSLYLNYDNNSFDFNDFIFKGTGEYADSLITFLHPSYDVDLFLNKLKTRNILSEEVNESIFSLGFRAKNLYFTFDILERVSAKVSFPKDFLSILLKGNADFLGETADFSGFGVDLNWYREFGLGVSSKIGDKLTFGARGKLLFGKANLTTNRPVPDMGLYTDPTTLNLKFHSNISLNVSGPIDVITENDTIKEIDIRDDIDPLDLILNSKNTGFGIDLGVEYKFNNLFTLSASVIDLGFIQWTQDTYNFTQDGEFEFNGFDVSSAMVINGDWDFEEEAENLLDSIVDLFDIQNEGNAYTTYLSPKVYLGGSVNITDKLNFGILSRSEIYGNKIRESLTLSANTLLAKFLSFSLTYSMMNNTYDNLGIGFAIKGGPLQFYMVSDHIPVTFNQIRFEDNGDETKIPIPVSLRTINLRFGLNWIFGCKQKKLYDKPLIM